MLNKALFALLILVTSGCALESANVNLLSTPVINEDFDHGSLTPIAAKLLQHSNLELAIGDGVNGSTGLRASYQGYHRGSKRMTARIPLGETGPEYSLNYDVRFESGFQFVKGGKLHGLGPDKHVSGGNAMRSDGWSARATFAKKGGLSTYVYHQDLPKKYGEHGKIVVPFSFTQDRYYAVTLHVKLNSSTEKADGFVHLYVDGQLIERQDKLRLHADKENGAISQMLFSTFHGGHSPERAPRTTAGDYATVYATFDNFSVFRNKRIRLAPGT